MCWCANYNPFQQKCICLAQWKQHLQASCTCILQFIWAGLKSNTVKDELALSEELTFTFILFYCLRKLYLFIYIYILFILTICWNTLYRWFQKAFKRRADKTSIIFSKSYNNGDMCKHMNTLSERLATQTKLILSLVIGQSRIQ